MGRVASPSLQLSGRVALITGGARGIGLGTAQAMHRRGARVALVDIDASEAERSATGLGEGALGIGGDVTDRKSLAAAVATVREQLGGIDVVVANAGIAQPLHPISVVDPEAFDRVLAINLGGVVDTVRLTLDDVIERRGHVLVISSVYSFVNGALQSSYAMSKAAVEQFGRALRTELAASGASAGVGYFGFVDTAMVRGARQDPLADRLEEIAPRVLHKQIQPAQAGEALAAAVERRAARTIRPRRWAVYSALRGVLNPVLDAGLARHSGFRGAVAEVERRERELS